jgi:hypothetical protein
MTCRLQPRIAAHVVVHTSGEPFSGSCVPVRAASCPHACAFSGRDMAGHCEACAAHAPTLTSGRRVPWLSMPAYEQACSCQPPQPLLIRLGFVRACHRLHAGQQALRWCKPNTLREGAAGPLPAQPPSARSRGGTGRPRWQTAGQGGGARAQAQQRPAWAVWCGWASGVGAWLPSAACGWPISQPAAAEDITSPNVAQRQERAGRHRGSRSRARRAPARCSVAGRGPCLHDEACILLDRRPLPRSPKVARGALSGVAEVRGVRAHQHEA